MALLSNLQDFAHGHQRKTPPQVGPGQGLQRAVRLGGLSPGLRTERRGQDDTPKRKMVRARLPSIAKGLIQFGCCAATTVQMASRSRRFLRSIAGNWLLPALSSRRPSAFRDANRVTGRVLGPSRYVVARIYQIAPGDSAEAGQAF